MAAAAEQLREALLADGALRSADAVMTPLSGGVSSEIFLVVDGPRKFVVKRALAKLKVEQDWFADTSRNRYEWAFMRYVAGFRPDATPKLLSAGQGYFCMEYLDGFSNWKRQLLAGRCDVDLARRAGALLGEIHAHSWGDEGARRAFDTIDNFDQLRIDPYLRATAARHPAIEPAISREVERLASTRQCLVHGDFSPKNLMFKDDRLVALDCEVAWYGDPAFDLAFLLNHLILKSLYHAPERPPFQQMVEAAIAGYHSANPHVDEVRRGGARLLPMLMVARVDGKSQVEYLTADSKRSFVRDFAVARLSRVESLDLDSLVQEWFETLDEFAA